MNDKAKSLDTFRQKIMTIKEQYEREIQKDGKDAVRSAVIELFEGIPTLEGVRWQQYTPYFNDGEECVFGVNDPEYITMTHSGDDDWDYSYARSFNDRFSKPEQDLLKKFEKNLTGMNDALKMIFGDHVQISMRRGDMNAEIKDYDHD